MASEKSTVKEYAWSSDDTDDVPLIIGTDQRKRNHFKAKKFLAFSMIIIFSFLLITAIIFFVNNDSNCDVIRENTAEMDDVENSCGSLFTCDYYLNTPCKSTCWHNTWDIRDRECENMGSSNCRWSFEAPMALIQGRCYCCDIKCNV